MAGTVKVETLVDAAARLGIINDTADARQSYDRQLRGDPAAAQRAVDLILGRAESSSGGRKVAAGRPTRSKTVRATRVTTATGRTEYPATWGASVAASQRSSGVRRRTIDDDRTLSRTQDPNVEYNPGMLMGHEARARVIETRGGRPVQREVHAAGDTPSYLEALRIQEQNQMRAAQEARARGRDPREAIRASAENALRLVEVRQAEVDRMEREVWQRQR